jgi:DNA (cytosine-5)-methyltransferase 1
LPSDLGDRRFAISSAKNEVDGLCKFHDYNFRQYKGKQPMNKIARNLVDYEAGKTILETAIGVITKQNVKQTELF